MKLSNQKQKHCEYKEKLLFLNYCLEKRKELEAERKMNEIT